MIAFNAPFNVAPLILPLLTSSPKLIPPATSNIAITTCNSIPANFLALAASCTPAFFNAYSIPPKSLWCILSPIAINRSPDKDFNPGIFESRLTNLPINLIISGIERATPANVNPNASSTLLGSKSIDLNSSPISSRASSTAVSGALFGPPKVGAGPKTSASVSSISVSLIIKSLSFAYHLI